MSETAQQYKKVLSVIESSKRLAAYTAVDQHVKPEHKVIGIGSGTTVPYVVERIVQQGAEVNKKRVFIPTGFQSKELIISTGLTLGDIDAYPQIDVTIDGADEVDENLNLIKGGGACQLREKVLAEAAKTFIVVADFRKNSLTLGTSYAPGVPIEVVPFAYSSVLRALHSSSPSSSPSSQSPSSSEVANIHSPTAALRMAVKKAGPIVSDNGNFIIDAPFPSIPTSTSSSSTSSTSAPSASALSDPVKLLKELKMLTGVVEVGLFCGIAKAAYFGNEDGSVTIRREGGVVEKVDAEES